MALDSRSYIFGEIRIKCCCRAMLSGKAKRFREQPDIGFGGTHDGNGAGVIFDDNLSTRAHSGNQRSEVARRFRFRDVNHILSHGVIIHRSFTLCFGREFAGLLGLVPSGLSSFRGDFSSVLWA